MQLVPDKLVTPLLQHWHKTVSWFPHPGKVRTGSRQGCQRLSRFKLFCEDGCMGLSADSGQGLCPVAPATQGECTT